MRNFWRHGQINDLVWSPEERNLTYVALIHQPNIRQTSETSLQRFHMPLNSHGEHRSPPPKEIPAEISNPATRGRKPFISRSNVKPS